MKKILLVLLLIMLKVNFINAQTIDVELIELDYLGSSKPHNITKGSDKIFFSADDGIHGRELWMYNLITNSAFLVKDIILGPQSGVENSFFFIKNNTLYFTANNGINGYELWKSDGTEAGTYMIKDINGSGDGDIGALTNFNDKIIFSANDSLNGQEMWITDGTENGTTLLKDIYSGVNGSYPSDFCIFNNLIYFVADNGINGKELWQSDGTSLGTFLFKDVNPSSNGLQNGNRFIVFNNNFYFFANNGATGFELWKSDGTNLGTQLLKDLYTGSNSSSYVIEGSSTNSYFVFSATTNVGKEIWRSDGTMNGTQLLKDINPIFDGIPPFSAQFVTYNNKVYFTADNYSNGQELWVTDGTTTGTRMVKDIYAGSYYSNIQKLTATNNFLIFSAMGNMSNFNTLWKSDGTTSGTVEIKNIELKHDNTTQLQFVEHNNEVYFQGGYDDYNGNELWKTNGTFNNINLVVDLNKKFGSNNASYYGDRFFTELNGQTIFISNNGQDGNEPFISDGTITGTRMIKNINPAEHYSSINTNDDYSPSLTKVGNNLFFRATNGVNGFELFKTDGTAANTVMVKDIAVGNSNSIEDYNLLLEYNNILYFKANNQINGGELWRSDGTEAGTYMLKDINPGSGDAIDGVVSQTSDSRMSKGYAIANNLLYFSAYDGISNSIWRTDGTTNGTVKVITIPSSGNHDSGPVILNSMNNQIFFTTNINNTTYLNNTLWVTDGTQSGCTLLGTWDITGSPVFSRTTVFNNELYFNVYTSNRNTLMKTNGTVSGTVVVKDNLGIGHNFKYLNSCGNFLYFSLGDYGVADNELWRTDGTINGTIKIADNPNNIFLFALKDYTCIDNHLIYLQEIDAKEIWVTDGNLNNTYNLNVNVLNGNDFSTYEGISKIGNYVNGKLFLVGGTESSGSEIYVTDFENLLSSNEFSNDLTKTVTRVFPNPTTGNLSISSNDFSIIRGIYLYDFSGKLISKEKCNSSLIKLNISNLSSGIYLAKIETDKSIETKKIIKK